MKQNVRFSVRDGAIHADGIYLGAAVGVNIPSDVRARVDRLALAAFGDAGFRIGLCDFGAREAGDAHHFDTASRIPSGA